jgi:4-hydroxybenzoate polyprenyltransferase
MIREFVRAARPEHYIKNLFVFAPIIFSGEIFAVPLLVKVIWTFVAFCLAASSVYFLNDLCDQNYDAIHPEKKNRPVAAGLISPIQAAVSSGSLFLGALLIGYFFANLQVAVAVFVYMFMNALYSLKLKFIVLVDIILIAVGFIIRILAGGLAIHVPISDWLLLCVGSLALFLALAKRRSEYIKCNSDNNQITRKVLDQYSEKLLDIFIVITATLSIITYSLYSVLNVINAHLIFTTPFVIYGIFRYLYLIYYRNRGTNPEKEMFRDKPLLLTICLWVITSIAIITYFQ